MQRAYEAKESYKDDLKRQIQNKIQKEQAERARKESDFKNQKQLEEHNRLNQMIRQQEILQAKRRELQRCLELSKKNKSSRRKRELDDRLRELEYLREIEIEFKHEIDDFKDLVVSTATP